MGTDRLRSTVERSPAGNASPAAPRMQCAGALLPPSVPAWTRFAQTSLPLQTSPLLARSVSPRLAPGGAQGTPPEPQVDLSTYKLHTLTRPDGRTLQIDQWGDLVIPDLLIPGGVEMEPLVIDGPQARLQCFGDSGKGTPDQFEVAANIVAMADERGVHASMHLGDIIYPAGIVRPDDPRIDTLYREPYGALRNPHAVLGNHEYGSWNEAGIAETWLDVAKIGKPGMFAMPARYYSQRILVDGMTIRCLFIDSGTLAVDPLQIAWLTRELMKGADRTIVFGHHPIYSGGIHGTIPHMEKLLLPLLEEHADLYIAGHDHNLQFLRSDKGLPLVVSGSAGEPRLKPEPNGHSEFFSSTMGTTFLSIDKNGIDVDLVDGKTRKTLFTKHLDPKRPR